MLLQNADDLLFGESELFHLWSFRLSQSVSQTGLNLGGNVNGTVSLKYVLGQIQADDANFFHGRSPS